MLKCDVLFQQYSNDQKTVEQNDDIKAIPKYIKMLLQSWDLHIFVYKASVLQILGEKQNKFRLEKHKVCLHSNQRN